MTCKKCKQKNSTESFKFRNSKCDVCWNEYTKKYRAENADKFAENYKRYYEKKNKFPSLYVPELDTPTKDIVKIKIDPSFKGHGCNYFQSYKIEFKDGTFIDAVLELSSNHNLMHTYTIDFVKMNKPEILKHLVNLTS